MFDLFLPKSQTKISGSTSFNPYSSFVSNIGQSFTREMNKLLEPLSVKDMQQTMKRSQNFFRAIDSWKALQQNYVTKLAQIQNTFKQKVISGYDFRISEQRNTHSSNKSSSEMIDNQLVSLFETLITNHKIMFEKITYDISYVNLQTFQNLHKQIKDIVNQQKSYTKQLNGVKQQLQKVLNKKTKLRRQKEEQLMLKIFMQDGSQQFMMDQKLKKHTKYNQIKKQLQQYQLKVTIQITQVSQSVDQYQKSSQNLKKNHLQYYQKIDRLNECKYQTVMKMQIHLLTYYRNLVEGINGMNKEIQLYLDQATDYTLKQTLRQSKNKLIFGEIQRKNKQNKIRIEKNRRNQFQILDNLLQKNVGYVQYSLKLIDQKQFDDLLTYSKDKEVKSKIKRMIDSNEVNPEQTDETCRQIQLIKKIIRCSKEQAGLLSIFKNMINKNSKLRMNFIFLLQFFRINGKFQMTIQQFKPIYSLINQFMIACHENRDCFVLKQLMILLTTYYVTLQEQVEQDLDALQKDRLTNSIQDRKYSPQKDLELLQPKKKTSSTSSTKQKIYILQFFKEHELWHDIQFWQSLLIECIYSQKRNTIKNLVRGLESTQKKQMLEAQKTSILNQILYVVRNMIIFDFTQKDVKNFGLRFCKLLRIDDKSIKDIYKTVEQAIKEEIETQQIESIDKYLQKLLK